MTNSLTFTGAPSNYRVFPCPVLDALHTQGLTMKYLATGKWLLIKDGNVLHRCDSIVEVKQILIGYE